MEKHKAGFWRDLFQYARERKKWWIIPILIVLLLVTVLVVVSTSSALSPFIYTLF